MTKTAYLDANIIILLFEGSGPIHDALWDLILRFGSTGRFHTSALTMAEVLVLPFRERNIDLVETYQSGKGDWLTVLPIGPTVLDRAAMIRAAVSRIKLPDAIQIATASLSASDFLLSLDLGISDLNSFKHSLTGEALLPSTVILRPDVASLSKLTEAFES